MLLLALIFPFLLLKMQSWLVSVASQVIATVSTIHSYLPQKHNLMLLIQLFLWSVWVRLILGFISNHHKVSVAMDDMLQNCMTSPHTDSGSVLYAPWMSSSKTTSFRIIIFWCNCTQSNADHLLKCLTSYRLQSNEVQLDLPQTKAHLALLHVSTRTLIKLLIKVKIQ